MEEIKDKRKLSKNPLIICLALALVFAIVGFMDIKSNAAESLYTARLYCMASQTFEGTTREGNVVDQTVTSNSPIYAYVHNYTEPTTGDFSYRAHVISKSPISGNPNVNLTFTDSHGVTWYYSRGFDVGGRTTATINYSTWFAEGVDALCIINGPLLTPQEFMTAFKNGTLDYTQDIDYNSFVESDDLPIVQNVCFDRLETSERENGVNVKNIVDYLRFDSNSEYKLMIMLCPTIYSTYGSDSYIADFYKYEYPQWIYMCIADENLKEISCNLGEFIVPTNDISDIKTSDYYLYYEELVNSFTNNDYSVFKPTMAYRLAYVDVENGLVGPSTYIMPFSYNNAYPDKETYSYFTLYTDGSRNSEKIMNLKTWSAEYDASSGETSKDLEEVFQDMKDTVVNVGDYLKDKVVVDNDVDVKEATNWLYSVVDFIKTTPQMVGVVLAFLPQPILYGMFITIFLGCIASAIAIVKALI